jgi:hypothetical protein
MSGISDFALLHWHFASLADQIKTALITSTESGGQVNRWCLPARTLPL